MSSMQDSRPIEAQPLLPQVRMIWFFVITLLVALGLMLVQVAGRGMALAEAVVMTLLFLALFGILSMGTFLVGYLMGALEKAVQVEEEQPSSPFIDGRLPDQIIPPRANQQE
ncbi:MAG: hypothetical protein D6753_05645 [Planctomycetota bacterium]|nr:MAG: hypothetical protein D6753_05645 [Planctomycetota bacterium]